MAEAEAVVEVVVDVVTLTHVAIETPADPHRGGAPLLSEVVHARSILMHRGGMAEAEVVIGVAQGPDRYRSLALAHHLAEIVATGPKADRSLRDLAAHQQDGEEAQIEDQEPVTDLLDPLLDQSHHTHEHLEDAATQAPPALQAAAEVRQEGEDGRSQARDHVLDRCQQMRDGLLVVTGVVADEEHRPAHPTIYLAEALILFGTALQETTAA